MLHSLIYNNSYIRSSAYNGRPFSLSNSYFIFPSLRLSLFPCFLNFSMWCVYHCCRVFSVSQCRSFGLTSSHNINLTVSQCPNLFNLQFGFSVLGHRLLSSKLKATAVTSVLYSCFIFIEPLFIIVPISSVSIQSWKNGQILGVFVTVTCPREKCSTTKSLCFLKLIQMYFN